MPAGGMPADGPDIPERVSFSFEERACATQQQSHLEGTFKLVEKETDICIVSAQLFISKYNAPVALAGPAVCGLRH